MTPTCFKRQCSEIDLCNIASEADLFFKMGFFCRNEEDVDIRLGGGDAAPLKDVCNGPYSQVTSQSLSLRTDEQGSRDAGMQTEEIANQLRLSGVTVRRLSLAFAHVRQDAFSSRTLLL